MVRSQQAPTFEVLVKREAGTVKRHCLPAYRSSKASTVRWNHSQSNRLSIPTGTEYFGLLAFGTCNPYPRLDLKSQIGNPLLEPLLNTSLCPSWQYAMCQDGFQYSWFGSGVVHRANKSSIMTIPSVIAARTGYTRPADGGSVLITLKHGMAGARLKPIKEFALIHRRPFVASQKNLGR